MTYMLIVDNEECIFNPCPILVLNRVIYIHTPIKDGFMMCFFKFVNNFNNIITYLILWPTGLKALF